jgi:transposase
MPETRRKYDPEFKEGAVRIVRETGKPIAQIARDLGVHEGTLGNWVAKDRAEREGTEGLSMGDAAELKRLRAENAQLRMERDVLKRSVVLWVLCRVRHNTHYAEHGIMPSVVLNSLWGKGSVSTHSA